MHTPFDDGDEVFLLNVHLDLPHDEVQTFEFAELRAVLISILFCLLPLVYDLLLDTQLFMVHSLRSEDKLLELGPFRAPRHRTSHQRHFLISKIKFMYSVDISKVHKIVPIPINLAIIYLSKNEIAYFRCTGTS